jgi:hypothetical protein
LVEASSSLCISAMIGLDSCDTTGGNDFLGITSERRKYLCSIQFWVFLAQPCLSSLFLVIAICACNVKSASPHFAEEAYHDRCSSRSPSLASHLYVVMYDNSSQGNRNPICKATMRTSLSQTDIFRHTVIKFSTLQEPHLQQRSFSPMG